MTRLPAERSGARIPLRTRNFYFLHNFQNS